MASTRHQSFGVEWFGVCVVVIGHVRGAIAGAGAVLSPSVSLLSHLVLG